MKRMHVLTLYVARHCPLCHFSRTLAADAARRFPELRVRFVDLDRRRAAPPKGIFIVPAFVLNGRIIFLGNPTAAELRTTLEGELRKHEPLNAAR